MAKGKFDRAQKRTKAAKIKEEKRRKSMLSARTKDTGVKKPLGTGVIISSKKAKKAAAREAAYAMIGGRDAAANKSKLGEYRRVGSN